MNIDEIYKKIYEKMPDKTKSSGTFSIENSDCKCEFSFFNNGNEIFFTKNKGIFYHDVKLMETTENDFSFLSFCTNSHIKFSSITDKADYEIPKDSFYCGQIQGNLKSVGYFPKNQLFTNLNICLSKEMYESLHGKANNEKAFNLHEQRKLSPLQRIIIYQISNSDIFCDSLAMLFLESQILQLVYESFCHSKINLAQSDIKILKKAQEIILKDIANPPSIKLLARKCGTNDFKLKSEFKQYFGTTIFAMLREKRLETAKNLLKNDELSVQEAANMVGYKSISAFCKVFKQHFGILPVELKKQRKIHLT